MIGPEALEQYLTTGAPALGVRRVLGFHRFPSGLSSLSCRVDVEAEDGPASWVLRAEPEHGVIPPYDIVAEHALLSRVHDQGLPVPRPLHLEADSSHLGFRFMLMSYIEGDAYRSVDPRLAAEPELEQVLQNRFVEMLARVHAIEDHGLPTHPDGPASCRALVEVCRKRLADVEVLPRPLLRHALDVLDEKAPAAERLVLLHGDFRLPNLKWRDGEIVGILDWELARVGDPLSDIAFTQTVGAGSCAVVGDLADRYCEIAGIELDEHRIIYYQMLEMVKSTIIGFAAAQDIATGGTDLRMLSVAGLAATGESVISMLETQLDQLEGA